MVITPLKKDSGKVQYPKSDAKVYTHRRYYVDESGFVHFTNPRKNA